MKWDTIDNVKRANRKAGYHFFAEDSMRFFGSRVLPTLHEGVGGTFFVASEKRPMSSDRRLYTVRCVADNGEIATVGEFQQYETSKAAHDAAKRFAAGEPTE